MTASTPLKTASVLAFERKLDPSDALLYSGIWDKRQEPSNWLPIAVLEKSVRGTVSHRQKTKDQDPAKLDALISNPNPQTVDVAALPAHADTLKLIFTLRIHGGVGRPSACNNIDYQTKLVNTVKRYVDEHGFFVLAERYAHNLANGRFLWRNRIGAEQIEVNIEHLVQGKPVATWVFKSLEFSMRDFSKPDDKGEKLRALAKLIADGLAGTAHILLKVTAFARIGAAQEVYPSQELILDKSPGQKSKTLYSVSGIAGIHSQKIGNALRTIDSWHPDFNELGTIAVEPFGSVTTLGKACRRPKEKLDFYSLLDSWLLSDKVPAPEQQHYVIATLIRGGVFGEASKE